MSAVLNIAALSKRTGVAADTLRKWEQRYSVLRPQRTPGGQRRYSDLDIERVEWLCARLAEGYRISEAAALLGVGTESVGRTPAEVRRALEGALAESDETALSRLLDQAFALDLPTACSEVVGPFLHAVGEAWADGRVSVGQEHLATQAVRARLARRLAEARGGVRGRAVLACAPGERHDVGLLMLAALLRADGWSVTFLGQDTPFPDVLRLADSVGADVVCLSATMPPRPGQLGRGAPHGTPLLVGGQSAAELAAERPGARVVPGDAVDAVATIRALAA